jgi:hypothetical protein
MPIQCAEGEKPTLQQLMEQVIQELVSWFSIQALHYQLAKSLAGIVELLTMLTDKIQLNDKQLHVHSCSYKLIAGLVINCNHFIARLIHYLLPFRKEHLHFCVRALSTLEKLWLPGNCSNYSVYQFHQLQSFVLGCAFTSLIVRFYIPCLFVCGYPGNLHVQIFLKHYSSIYVAL